MKRKKKVSVKLKKNKQFYMKKEKWMMAWTSAGAKKKSPELRE